MALAANAFEAEISVEDNVSFRVLEQRVEHIQSDVAEMKTDMRRLEAKVESTRDTVTDVKDSVAALRTDMERGFAATNQKFAELAAANTVLTAKVERLDERTVTLDHKFDEKLGTLDHKFDEKFGTLDRKIDDRFGTLDRKIDEKFGLLDGKIDEKFGVLDGKIDRTRDELKEWVNALFDRKLFRAMSVIVGAMASIGMLISAAEKVSFGIYATIGIAIAIPVVLISATFLATRASR